MESLSKGNKKEIGKSKERLESFRVLRFQVALQTELRQVDSRAVSGGFGKHTGLQ